MTKTISGWRRVAALFLTASLAATPAISAERSITLQEAFRLALQKNDALVIERASLSAAGAAVLGARGAYDPTIELNADAQRSTEPANSAFLGASLAPVTRSTQVGVAVRRALSTGGALTLRANGSRETNEGPFARLSPAYGTQVGADFRQPLLRDRTMDEARLAMHVTVADQRGATASMRRALTETMAAVEKAYWRLAAARTEVGVREEALRLADQQLTETRTRVASGTAPGTELAQPRAELERRRAELLGSREALARADNGLKLLIFGDDDASAWDVAIANADTGSIDTIQTDVPSWMTRALASRPELEAYGALVTRRRAETLHARDAERPALDAVVSYDRYGLAGSANPVAIGSAPTGLGGDLGNSFHTLGRGDFYAFRAGLVLGLPLLNRSARGAAEAARDVERQAEADLARVRKTIRVEVLDAAAALETSTHRIEATRAAREAAEVQLAAENDRYTTGLSTNFLVLTRQNDLSRARLDEISARTDYLMARAELARATGSLIEERGIDVSNIGGSK